MIGALIRRGAFVVATSLVVLSTFAATAVALWSTSGSGSAAGAANVMPPGAKPSAAASGTSVTVTWTAVSLPGGAAVAGYEVRRYDASTGTPATVGSACTGVVTATSCTEANVPAGTWVYTDTPVLNNWSGSESANSTSVAVS